MALANPGAFVRRAAYPLGFRYRLHARTLPGTPDLAFSRLRAVINVNGCFGLRKSLSRHRTGLGDQRFPTAPTSRTTCAKRPYRGIPRSTLVQELRRSPGSGVRTGRLKAGLQQRSSNELQRSHVERLAGEKLFQPIQKRQLVRMQAL